MRTIRKEEFYPVEQILKRNQIRKTQISVSSTVFLRKIPGGLRMGCEDCENAISLIISLTGTMKTSMTLGEMSRLLVKDGE